MPFAATWTQLEIITLSEVRERQILYGITYKWNLKYGINEPIYKTGKEQTCSCQAGVREGEGWAGSLVGANYYI